MAQSRVRLTISGKLLIVPEGIEIRLENGIKLIDDFLLIVPEGIEIRAEIKPVRLNGLLIVPEGIEIASLHELIPPFLPFNRTRRN